MTHDELADEQRRSAIALSILGPDRHARAICSRAYYATYAVLSGRAPAGLRPRRAGWSNLEHSQIPGIIAQVRGLDRAQKERIREALERLWTSRVRSDYHPAAHVDGHEARERLRDCVAIVVHLRHG